MNRVDQEHVRRFDDIGWQNVLSEFSGDATIARRRLLAAENRSRLASVMNNTTTMMPHQFAASRPV